MIGFVVGVFLGVVLTIACFGVAFVLLSGKPMPDEAEKKAVTAPTNRELMSACRERAQMNNFWAYDGSEQTDSDEIARNMYDKEVMKRGRR